MYILQLFSLSYYCTLKITTVSYLETNEIKGPMPSELGKFSLFTVPSFPHNIQCTVVYVFSEGVKHFKVSHDTLFLKSKWICVL
jgi:hypothetical protein